MFGLSEQGFGIWDLGLRLRASLGSCGLLRKIDRGLKNGALILGVRLFGLGLRVYGLGFTIIVPIITLRNPPRTTATNDSNFYNAPGLQVGSILGAFKKPAT